MKILREFAAAHGITYPLLSDEGSRVMRGLGLINERVQEDHAAYGIMPDPRHVGLPYPGAFVLDRDGIVVRKRFHESYRERDTGAGLVAHALGIVAEPSMPVEMSSGPGITVRAWLDSPTYVFFQRLVLTVEVSIAAGRHVYGGPAGDGLTPLSIAIDAVDGLEAGPVRWPSPRRLTRSGASDGPWVYEGVVLGMLPLTFTAAPGGGDHVLGVTVRYQGCDDVSCLPAALVQLKVPVREAPLVGRSLPGPPSKG